MLRGREAQISQLNLGLCTPAGLGLALALPHRNVTVLDGDGTFQLLQTLRFKTREI